MEYIKKNKATILLEDGSMFFGNSVGFRGIATGEVCFNTGMTGYQEVFTDPSYYQQIMITTNAHIGNYGTDINESESLSPKIAALVCKNFTYSYSRVRSNKSLFDFFNDYKLIAVHDIDTRALVRHVREKGAMNAVISTDGTSIEELKKILSNVPSMNGLELASKVTTQKSYFYGDKNSDFKISVLDVGVKKNILDCMSSRGAYLKVFPSNTSYDELIKWMPDGFFISNGPGDPSVMHEVIETTKKIMNSKHPKFGICLGHQLMAISVGISTYKMHNGHRGINHPVQNLETGQCEVTSQNHGFSVKEDDIKKDFAKITHLNLNDKTVEGLEYIGKNAFSVQYHPESSPGPHDSRYLFDKFIDKVKKK